ncbi:DUF1127 domain-containing protein [Pseudooceanicola spongiae]|jgi:uncharacterized protein YjiS (DUF1127 family)|uniref:DUF1127 domain-containing protein n=1 Tax=Pseudooceanicola spongiae TaxID=2613965 RepID=A0A7L9WLA8_9RHOB|nr:DUF1127 domain-containing protein [Pseudooceanicola spongiae]QOL81185.1 DUF1127 domain-containing protein [Pseudooceanicola spongiae]|tara:strand:- start:524 stop:718 length:195 start_codon:yes stop_codon:yes gene_type:complete
MTATNFNAPTAPRSKGASPFSLLVSAVTTWNDTRVTRNALSRLTDRELNDIGLVRGDIEDVARS